MSIVKTTVGRRSFLKATALTSGGLMLGFNSLISCTNKTEEEILALPKEWFEINEKINGLEKYAKLYVTLQQAETGVKTQIIFRRKYIKIRSEAESSGI